MHPSPSYAGATGTLHIHAEHSSESHSVTPSRKDSVRAPAVSFVFNKTCSPWSRAATMAISLHENVDINASFQWDIHKWTHELDFHKEIMVR